MTMAIPTAIQNSDFDLLVHDCGVTQNCRNFLDEKGILGISCNSLPLDSRTDFIYIKEEEIRKNPLIFWLGIKKMITICTLKISPDFSLGKGQGLTTQLKKRIGRPIGKHKRRAFEMKQKNYYFLSSPFSLSLCV